MSMILLASGCAKNNSSTADSAPSTNGSLETPAPNGASWDQVSLEGKADGGMHDGALLFFIDKANQALVIQLPLPVIMFPFLSNAVIPDMPDAKVTVITNPNGNKVLGVSVPLKYIVKGAEFVEPQRLPNGDPLPGVPAGELPGFAIQFPSNPDYQLHLYIGVNVAIVFVTLPNFNIPFYLLPEIPIYNKAKTKKVGTLKYIAPKGMYDGGLYLAAQLPADLARVIDDLIRW